jgi:hypothetical protein
MHGRRWRRRPGTEQQQQQRRQQRRRRRQRQQQQRADAGWSIAAKYSHIHCALSPSSSAAPWLIVDDDDDDDDALTTLRSYRSPSSLRVLFLRLPSFLPSLPPCHTTRPPSHSVAVHGVPRIDEQCQPASQRLPCAAVVHSPGSQDSATRAGRPGRRTAPPAPPPHRAGWLPRRRSAPPPP